MTAGPAAPTAAPIRTGRAPARTGDLRRTLYALLASALGVFPLNELFTDRGWMIDAWLAMIVVVGPAAILRRTRLASAGQIWIGVVLLIPWLTVNFVRAHALLGFIPSAGAWHEVGHLMTNLHRTTTHGVAPVHSTVAIRLALCALFGLIAALIDLVAVVGRRGALAGVPLLVAFTVAGAVPRHPVLVDLVRRGGRRFPHPARAGLQRRSAALGALHPALEGQPPAGRRRGVGAAHRGHRHRRRDRPAHLHPVQLAQLRRQPVPSQRREQRGRLRRGLGELR